jgi:hypothetical protein
MRELGQFLAGPGALLNVPGVGMVLGLAALCATLAIIVSCALRPLFPEVRWRKAVAAIPVLALGGVAAVLLLQWAAQWLHAGGGVPGRYSAAVTARAWSIWILEGIGWIIGWGYAESLADRPFGDHILSFTIGVALVEELVKGLLGCGAIGLLLFANNPSKRDPLDVSRTRFLALVCVGFLVGGLSYGAGEAIFYFQVYAGIGAPIWAYLMRSVWCVCLHGAWAVLTGMAVALVLFPFYTGTWEPSDSAGERPNDHAAQAMFLFGLLVYMCLCAPAVVLHGLYDAACIHDDTAAWLVGAFSLALCVLLLASLLYLSRRAGQTAGTVK